MSAVLSKILTPSVAILNRLTFTWKFAIIFILYLVPIAYFAVMTLSEHTKSIDKVQLERDGLSYMLGIRPLLEHLALARGLTNAYHHGKTEHQKKIKTIHINISDALRELIIIDKKLSKVLRTENQAVDIQNDWNSLSKGIYSMKPQVAFTAHTVIIKKLLALKAYVLESSKLLLDPSLDSNFMANALSLWIPAMVDNLGKARGLGTGIVETRKFTPDSYVQLNTYIQNIMISNTALMHGFDVIFENNENVSKQLSGLRTEVNSSIKQFTEFNVIMF